MTNLHPDLAPGSQVAGYRIEEPVGRGGMGVVYRATQLGLNRAVALKLIAPEFADDDGFRERFKRESELAASIDHPNVIPIYEAGESAGRLFIAMRYVEGTDLRSMLVRETRLEPARAVRCVTQLAAALDAAHRRGLVHRDVKPANVLVAQHGGEHLYLTDFGLTKRTGSESALTGTGQVVGTIDYVAPEQIEGKGTDARTDVYALGCVLYHLLTGQVPFPRDAEVARMYAHLHDPAPVASTLGPLVPPELDRVVVRAMAKDPAARHPSAGDVARAAQAALTGGNPTQLEQSVASGTAAPTRLDAGTRATMTVPVRDRLPARRRTILAIGAGLLLVAGGGALAVALTGDGEDVSRPRAGPREPGIEATTIRNVGNGPDGITVDGENVWVTLAKGNALRRIDAGTSRPVGGPVPVGANPDSVVADRSSLWVTNTNGRSLRRVELAGGEVRPGPQVLVGNAPEGVALGTSALWVGNATGHTVQVVSRETDQLAASPINVGLQPVALAVGSRYVWVASAAGTVARIDPGSARQYDRLRVGGEPRGIAIGGGRAWVSDNDHDSVLSLRESDGKIAGRSRVRSDPREVAYGLGSVWVVHTAGNSVTRIDARTGKVLNRRIRVGRHPIGIAVGAGAVWVANFEGGSVTRLRPAD